MADRQEGVVANQGAAPTPDANSGLYRTIVADPPWDHSDGTGYSFGNRDPRGRSGQHEGGELRSWYRDVWRVAIYGSVDDPA